jgi:hypothetical protein
MGSESSVPDQFTRSPEGDLRRVVSLPHDFDLESWEKAVNQYRGLPGLLLPTSWARRFNYSCMENNAYELVYPCARGSLADLIAARRKDKQPFSAPELWFFMLGILEGCRVFERRRERIGQVHPEHVLIDSAGQLLQVTRYSWPCEFIGPQMILEGGRGAFLSPQELAQLKMKMLYGRDEPNSDSFSIGMTILEAGLLTPVDVCYDYYNFAIDEKEFQRLQRDFKASYEADSFLVKTVFNLLELNDLMRPSPGQIASLLEPYRG